MLQMSWKRKLIQFFLSSHGIGQSTSICVIDTLVTSCDTSGHCYAKSWKGLLGDIAPTTVITVAYKSLNRQQKKIFFRAFPRQSGSGSVPDNNEEILNHYIFW